MRGVFQNLADEQVRTDGKACGEHSDVIGREVAGAFQDSIRDRAVYSDDAAEILAG